MYHVLIDKVATQAPNNIINVRCIWLFRSSEWWCTGALQFTWNTIYTIYTFFAHADKPVTTATTVDFLRGPNKHAVQVLEHGTVRTGAFVQCAVCAL